MNEHLLSEPLSRRELEILALMCQHLTDREIAERLFVAVPTVKWYNRQIFDKLDVKNRREAVNRANTLGLPTQNGAAEPAPVKHNLPSQLTPFIGRSSELAAVEASLAHPHTRLLTILAPGGMGKTRLALEAAERSLSRYADGVFFAPLAALTSVELVIASLAEALGLQFVSDGRTQEQQLADFLRRKHLLLVIDNFEHLLDAAPLITNLLTAAPKVTALVTSRERLNLSGETVFSLAGLHYPEADSKEAPLRFGASQLFVECALRANARFVISDAEAVGRLCRRVQGMPLAIELAAAMVKALSVEEIDAEIARSADFLHTTMVDVPERLRSVRVVFEAAWARLDESTRQVFRRMSVFRGGCTREAAQAVTGASIRTLAALVDKALLWRNPQTNRYDIHELLRQYAEVELECAGETQAIKQAHQEYYAALTTQWGSAMMFDRVEEGLTLFDADIDNVRSAFARASERAIAAELDPFPDIWLYYDIRAKWREGLAEIEAACAALEPHDSIPLARLLFIRSDFLDRLKIETGDDHYGTRAADMLRRMGDKQFLPLVMAIEGNEHLRANDPGRAREIYLEGLAIAREGSQGFPIAVLLHRVAWASHRIGDSEQRLARITESYQWAKSLNNSWLICFCASSLAHMKFFAGQIDEAEPLYLEGLEYSRRLRFSLNIIEALQGLAAIADQRGDLEACRQYNDDTLEIQKEYGFTDPYLFDTLVILTDVSLRRGDLEEASYYFRAARSYMSEKSIEILFNLWRYVAGYFLMKLGYHAQAAALLSIFERFPYIERLDNQRYKLQPNPLEECCAALPPEEFEAACMWGESLTKKEAIALVDAVLR